MLAPFSAPAWAGERGPIYGDVTEGDDTNLVAAALRGDAESFSPLCERHYPALVAIAYRGGTGATIQVIERLRIR